MEKPIPTLSELTAPNTATAYPPFRSRSFGPGFAFRTRLPGYSPITPKKASSSIGRPNVLFVAGSNRVTAVSCDNSEQSFGLPNPLQQGLHGHRRVAVAGNMSPQLSRQCSGIQQSFNQMSARIALRDRIVVGPNRRAMQRDGPVQAAAYLTKRIFGVFSTSTGMLNPSRMP